MPRDSCAISEPPLLCSCTHEIILMIKGRHYHHHRVLSHKTSQYKSRPCPVTKQQQYETMKLHCATIAILALAGSTNAFAPSTTSFRTASPLNAVAKKDSYDITLLPGDGIGPEIMTACKEVLGALTTRCGFELKMTDALIGGAAIDEKNDPFPDESLEQCLKSDSVLLSCIGGYKVGFVDGSSVWCFRCRAPKNLINSHSFSIVIVNSGTPTPVSSAPNPVSSKCVNPWAFLPTFVLPRSFLSLLMPPPLRKKLLRESMSWS